MDAQHEMEKRDKSKSEHVFVDPTQNNIGFYEEIKKIRWLDFEASKLY